MDTTKPKALLKLFLELYALDWKEHNWRDVFPWCFGICMLLGTVFGYALRIQTQSDQQNLISIYSSLVTAQGIILALAFNSVQQSYLTISKGKFAQLLKNYGLLDGYIFLMRFQQWINVVSLVLLVIALPVIYLYGKTNVTGSILFSRLGGYNTISFVSISISMGIFLYSLKHTADSFRMASELSHYKSIFAERKTPSSPSSPTP